MSITDETSVEDQALRAATRQAFPFRELPLRPAAAAAPPPRGRSGAFGSFGDPADDNSTLPVRKPVSEKRVEQLYVSDEYGVFFVTGQTQSGSSSGAADYISVRTFNSMKPEEVESLRGFAEKWDAAKSKVDIRAKGRELVFTDAITKTDSSIDISLLDDGIRNKLQPPRLGNAAVWNKFSAVTSGATGQDTSAPEQATFRKKTVQPGQDA